MIDIHALISYREKIGVNSKNPYIFVARTRNCLKPVRGNDFLALLFQEWLLKVPEGINSNKLRKSVANILQIILMKKNENGLPLIWDIILESLDKITDSKNPPWTIELAIVSTTCHSFHQDDQRKFF